MKSGAIESSRRKEQEERRPEQQEFKEMECSEVRHRSHRTDISGGTGRVESRRSTVVRHETSVPATRQEKERTEERARRQKGELESRRVAGSRERSPPQRPRPHSPSKTSENPKELAGSR